MGQMHGGRTFAGPTLKVHQLPDLKLFISGPAGQVAPLFSRRFLEDFAGIPDFLCRVVTPSAALFLRFGDGAFGMHFAHELSRNTQKFSRLGGGETAERFGVVGRKGRQ